MVTARIQVRNDHQHRRESTTEQLTVISAAMAAFDAQVGSAAHADPDARPADELRSAVRVLLQLAVRTPGFDATVSVAQAVGVSVRIRHLGTGLDVDVRSARPPASSVVTELADLLRGGRVDRR